MENKALIKLVEYPLTQRELQVLNLEIRACFSLFCHGVSEINALQRLFILTSGEPAEEKEILIASSIQTNVLMRTLSSKLFELREFLEFKGKYNRTNDEELIAFGKSAGARLAKLDDSEGFKFAKKLRHEAAFHYQMKPARERQKHIHETADASLYMTKAEGGSFFPYGEEALFIGLINQTVDATDNKDAAKKLINSWSKWSTEFIRTLNEIFSDFFERFVQVAFPNKYAKEKVFWVSSELVGEIRAARSPVFLRTKKGV